jgi:hypothetical protein
MLGPVAWIADFCANLLTVKPVERQIGGENEADDGTLSVPVGEKIHGSVFERYRGDYLPESVRHALGAKVEMFKERAERRHELPGTENAVVNGVACPLLDIAPAGACVRASWLAAGAEVAFQRTGYPACQARVVWRRDDQAGLQLVAKEAATRTG